MQIRISDSQLRTAGSGSLSSTGGFLFIKVEKRLSSYLYKVKINSTVFEIRSRMQLKKGDLLKVRVAQDENGVLLKIVSRFSASAGNSSGNIQSQLAETVYNFYRSTRRFKAAGRELSDKQLLRRSALSAITGKDYLNDDNPVVEPFFSFGEQSEGRSSTSDKKKHQKSEEKVSEDDEVETIESVEILEDAAQELNKICRPEWKFKFFSDRNVLKLDGFISYCKNGNFLANYNMEIYSNGNHYFISVNFTQKICCYNFHNQDCDEAQKLLKEVRRLFSADKLVFIKLEGSYIFDGFNCYPAGRLNCVI
jgi:hypothetical protein